MKTILRELSVAFTAGVVGTLAAFAFFWIFNAAGGLEYMDVRMTPRWDAEAFYLRLIWGGALGGLFMLPLLPRSIIIRSIVYSAVPSFIQLFIIFPMYTGNGLMGLQLGGLTPVYIALCNLVWGFSTSIWYNNIK